MTKLPQFLRSRLALQQTALDGHPSANTLAAFAEQTLPGRARAGLLEHLARCPECREILAAASAPEAGRVPGIAWWKWRWAAAAAACLVAALLWRPGSLEDSLAERIPPAPAAPSAPKTEEPPKVDVAKPRTPSPRHVPVLPKQATTEARAMPTLPQTTTLPPLKLNLTLPKPLPAVAETTSLKIPEANNELAQLSGRAQPEKPQQNRTGVMEPNRIFQFGMRASAAKTGTRPTLQPNGEKSLWILNDDLRKSDDGGKTWRVVRVDDRARLYALAVDGSDVWAGGADGALFHSVDGGLNWQPIVVAGADARLTETITRIDARDENRVKLKTRSGDWLTTDAGLHWQRE